MDDPSPDTVRTRSDAGAPLIARRHPSSGSLLGGRADAPPPEWETRRAGEEVVCHRSPRPWRGARRFCGTACAASGRISLCQNWSDAWVTARLEEMVRFAIATSTCSARTPARQESAHLRREQLWMSFDDELCVWSTLTRCYREYAPAEERVDRAAAAPTKDWGLAGGVRVRATSPFKRCCVTSCSCGWAAARRHNTSSFGGDMRREQSALFARSAKRRGPPSVELRASRRLRAPKRRCAHDQMLAECAATFLRLMASKECSYLRACCLHEHVNGARVHALRVAYEARLGTKPTLTCSATSGRRRSQRLDWRASRPRRSRPRAIPTRAHARNGNRRRQENRFSRSSLPGHHARVALAPRARFSTAAAAAMARARGLAAWTRPRGRRRCAVHRSSTRATRPSSTSAQTILGERRSRRRPPRARV